MLRKIRYSFRKKCLEPLAVAPAMHPLTAKTPKRVEARVDAALLLQGFDVVERRVAHGVLVTLNAVARLVSAVSTASLTQGVVGQTKVAITYVWLIINVSMIKVTQDWTLTRWQTVLGSKKQTGSTPTQIECANMSVEGCPHGSNLSEGAYAKACANLFASYSWDSQ